jgi:hypothetical protein
LVGGFRKQFSSDQFGVVVVAVVGAILVVWEVVMVVTAG